MHRLFLLVPARSGTLDLAEKKATPRRKGFPKFKAKRYQSCLPNVLDETRNSKTLPFGRRKPDQTTSHTALAIAEGPSPKREGTPRYIDL